MNSAIASDEASSAPNQITHWLTWLRKRLTIRLLFLALLAAIGFTIVSIDSSQHQAAAATIDSPEATLSAMSSARSPSEQRSLPSIASEAASTQGTDWHFDRRTAERLSHSDLTSANLTRSRLTRSHLFTRRVR